MNGLLARFWYGVALAYRFHGLRSKRRRIFRQSERAFSRALHFDAELHAARFYRGLLYWRELHEPSRAVQDLSEVLTQTTHFPDSLFVRGMAHLEMTDYHAAADDLEIFLKIYPESRWADSARRQLEIVRAILDEMPLLIDSGTSSALT
jgi:regulator of sirC expression with transglutaminase-like and TPR domain